MPMPRLNLTLNAKMALIKQINAAQTVKEMNKILNAKVQDGVNQDSAQERIKIYRSLSIELHPDKISGGEKDAELRKEAKEAFKKVDDWKNGEFKEPVTKKNHEQHALNEPNKKNNESEILMLESVEAKEAKETKEISTPESEPAQTKGEAQATQAKKPQQGGEGGGHHEYHPFLTAMMRSNKVAFNAVCKRLDELVGKASDKIVAIWEKLRSPNSEIKKDLENKTKQIQSTEQPDKKNEISLKVLPDSPSLKQDLENKEAKVMSKVDDMQEKSTLETTQIAKNDNNAKNVDEEELVEKGVKANMGMPPM